MLTNLVNRSVNWSKCRLVKMFRYLDFPQPQSALEIFIQIQILKVDATLCGKIITIPYSTENVHAYLFGDSILISTPMYYVYMTDLDNPIDFFALRAICLAE